MNNQCHMINCRYNVNAKCTSEKDYQVCTEAVIGVLGKDRYNSFLKWESYGLSEKEMDEVAMQSNI